MAPLGPDERHLSYTLTVDDCGKRLALAPTAVRELLRAPQNDPCHLPHALVRCNGGQGYRVRPADLEALAARISTPPLPPDPIRRLEAITILAGKRPRGATAYGRHAQRLEAAIGRGEVTRYRLLGDHRDRYSRAEVETLRLTLEAAGVGERAARSRRHIAALAKSAEDEGLVDSATAQELCSVSRGTPNEWGRQGWYGARKVGGWWFFERKELPTSSRAPREPSRTIPCAGKCGRVVTRRASRVRETIARGGRFYCDECWPAARADVIQEARRLAPPRPSAETRQRMSEAHHRAWDEGKRDREAQSTVMRDVAVKLRSSPTRHVEQVEAMMRARGLALTGARRKELAGRALSRAQRNSGRSRETRRLEQAVAALDAKGMTAPEIHDALQGEFQGVTESYVRKIRQRLGLSQRKPGPRRRVRDKTR